MPKVPKPPAPPAAPQRVDAEAEADKVRRRLILRAGAASSVKTGPSGATDYGRNAQVTSLGAGTRTTLGVGQ